MKELLRIALFLAPMLSPLQVRNGVVTGQLLSKNGQSVSGIRVSAMAVADASIPVSNASTLVSLAITDSAGKYRLENVSPGRYYITAGLVDAPSYFPGVSTLSGATVVSVVAGAVVAGIDFPLTVPVGVAVSGRVILPPSQPVAGVLRAALIGGPGPLQETTLSPDGSFQFLKVRPGTYSLLVSTGGPSQTQSIVVADRDVTGIEIVPSVTVAWTVSVEGGGPVPARFTLSFAPFKGGVTVPNATITNDVLWRIQLPEGEYRTAWASLPAGYMLKSITAGSVDLLKDPLKVAANTASTSIAVTLAVGSPPPWVNVSGKVIDPGGILKDPSSQLTLLAISGGATNATNTFINPDGSFEFHQVLPGRYYARLIPAFPIPTAILDISNKDLSGVEIVLPVVKEISGRIVIEGPGQITPRLNFAVTEPSGSPTTSVTAVGLSDGTFKVTLPEGERRISLNVTGYSVKSLNYGSQDVIRNPLLKVSGKDDSEFRVTLTPTITVSGGLVGGVVGGIVGGIGPPPPPPPPLPLPSPPSGAGAPIRVGGDVQAGNLIFHPNPAYPPLARAARIEGSVILQATIAEDGSVKDLRVITSSNPLLLPGVIETVKTWQYKPVMVNQTPVEVITTITISFSLGAAAGGAP